MNRFHDVMGSFCDENRTDALLQAILYELRVANWMTDGRRGPKPKQPTPKPREYSADEIREGRQKQAQHLKRRREERGAA